jgi:hypothetical protein
MRVSQYATKGNQLYGCLHWSIALQPKNIVFILQETWQVIGWFVFISKFPKHSMVTDSLWEKMKLAVQTLYGWVDPDHQLNDSSAKFHHAQFTKYRNLANGCLNA